MKNNAGILLIGVGGGGCQLAAKALQNCNNELQTVGIDTDAMELKSIKNMRSLLLGQARLLGNGTGGDIVKGRNAALDDIQLLHRELDGVQMAIVMTCLGGGTGGGVTPELFKLLNTKGITTICFATQPFSFESDSRKQIAQRCIPIFEGATDTLVLVPMEKLFSQTQKENVVAAYDDAARIIGEGLSMIWRVMVTPGFIRFDPARLRYMLQRGQTAKLGMVSAIGDDRATVAVERLRETPLLSGGLLEKANAVALGIMAGADLRLAEIDNLMRYLRKTCKKGCYIEMGTVFDHRFDGQLLLVALLFENWVKAGTDGVIESGGSSSDVSDIQFDIGHIAKGRKNATQPKSSMWRFRGVEPTLHGGVSLDIPTYVRKKIVLER